MSRPIRIVPGSPAEVSLWRTTREVAGLFAGWVWALIGAQMVTILEREHGVVESRATRDVDALFDVRAVSGSVRAAADRLIEAGFEPRPTPDGLVYRFGRGEETVDVLAPDHVGSRADLTTVPPWSTLEVAGGSQALARRGDVLVEIHGDRFSVPVPSLVGALIMKARAAAESRERKHLYDLARLLALVGDVDALRGEMTARERGYLRVHGQLRDGGHPAWQGIARAEDGIIALGRLSS